MTKLVTSLPLLLLSAVVLGGCVILPKETVINTLDTSPTSIPSTFNTRSITLGGIKFTAEIPPQMVTVTGDTAIEIWRNQEELNASNQELAKNGDKLPQSSAIIGIQLLESLTSPPIYQKTITTTTGRPLQLFIAGTDPATWVPRFHLPLPDGRVLEISDWSAKLTQENHKELYLANLDTNPIATIIKSISITY